MHRLRFFSKGEWLLWGISVTCIVLSFCLIPGGKPLSLVASLIGVTSLIFCAKGHPVGQVLMLVFSALYGVVSYTCAYYGEMITYLGMTAPMALFSLVSWLRHPFQGQRSQVAVARLSRTEALLLVPLTSAVTLAFFFILRAMNTVSLLPSTLSVATSFAAAYLTFRRSPYFALVYAANDLVLIVLWIIMSLHDRSYIPMLVCFVIFFINDLYGFISWRRMEHRQRA